MVGVDVDCLPAAVVVGLVGNVGIVQGPDVDSFGNVFKIG